jgi:integrase
MRKDYLQAINSRILPYFGEMPFARITATVVQSFIGNIDRCDRTKAKKRKGKPGKPLSVKRLKNITGPMKKIWIAACNDFNWNLRDPFTGVSAAYEQHAEKTLQMKAEEAIIRVLHKEKDTEVSTREVFLFSEWQKLLNHIDPHYHVVVDLLLMGVIGSELEALLKQHVDGDDIQICCAVVRDEEGRPIFKTKPKNWYRKRDIPKTRRLRELLDKACAASISPAVITFANGITIPANEFVLTMLDGSPFIYSKFVKSVWNKAKKEAGLKEKVPYACRHTFVAWSSLIGVLKERLVGLMGHSTKKMIDEKYGKYRKGLVDEKKMILEYLGDDFLSLEELRTAFPERYQERMAVPVIPPQKAQAPAPTIAFCQSFGQSQGLYADNYAT